MLLITGIAMLWIGLILIHRYRQASKQDTSQCRDRQQFQELRHDLKDTKIQELLEQHELDYLVTLSAVNRETKYKAALEAVLKSNGATQDQIDKLFDSIESE